MYKIYSQCCVYNSKFPVSRWAFVASLYSCVPFNALLSNIKMPEPSNNTNHSAEAARAWSHFTETNHFPACLLPVLCGAFNFCIAPIGICIWDIYKRTQNLAYVDEKFQTRVEKAVCILSFSLLEVFPGVLAYWPFLCSSRSTGFVSHRISKNKISKPATISSFVTISQELINKQMKADQSLQLLPSKEYSYLQKTFILAGLEQNAWEQSVKTSHNNWNEWIDFLLHFTQPWAS